MANYTLIARINAGTKRKCTRSAHQHNGNLAMCLEINTFTNVCVLRCGGFALLSALQSSATFAPAASLPPPVDAVNQSVTAIDPVSQVTAPISGSPIRSMATLSRKHCPLLRRPRRPSEKWRSSTDPL